MEHSSRHRARYYSPAIISELTDSYAIPEAKIGAMVVRLERSALQVHEDNKMTNAQHKEYGDAAFKAFKALEKAISHLNEIPNDAWENLINDSPIGSYSAPTAITYSGEFGSLEEDAKFLFPGSGPQNYHDIRLSEVKDKINILNEVLLFTANSSFNPRGRQVNFQLRKWIAQIRSFWVRDLERSFTRDFTNNSEPISEAARFCVEAYKIIKPATPNSEIQQAMKKHIAELNDWKKSEIF